MVPKLDLVGVFVDMAGRNDFVVHLLAFSNDVESVAHLNAHVLVFRRVIDAVFTDELLVSFVVFFIEPDGAGR